MAKTPENKNANGNTQVVDQEASALLNWGKPTDDAALKIAVLFCSLGSKMEKGLIGAIRFMLQFPDIPSVGGWLVRLIGSLNQSCNTAIQGLMALTTNAWDQYGYNTSILMEASKLVERLIQLGAASKNAWESYLTNTDIPAWYLRDVLPDLLACYTAGKKRPWHLDPPSTVKDVEKHLKLVQGYISGVKAADGSVVSDSVAYKAQSGKRRLRSIAAGKLVKPTGSSLKKLSELVSAAMTAIKVIFTDGAPLMGEEVSETLGQIVELVASIPAEYRYSLVSDIADGYEAAFRAIEKGTFDSKEFCTSRGLVTDSESGASIEV